MAVKMTMFFFWVVTPRSLVGRCVSDKHTVSIFRAESPEKQHRRFFLLVERLLTFQEGLCMPQFQK
jgi:hypothetical protein